MADLKARSVRGGTITMAAQGVKFLLQMGSVVVLARLLTPNDYGLVAMVIAITGFVAMFKDMGLSMATVQKANINHSQVSTLFWINVLIGFGIMVITAAIAPAVAWFYGERRLMWITLALASAFLFGGLTVQHQALLRRQMRFGRLAAIEVISILVGISIAIVSASYGAGCWALVLMQLAIAITTAIGVWVACKWRPGLPVRNSGVRSMLAFGGHLTGFSIVNYFTRNLDKILIGWRWGTQSLGLYSRAYSLLMLPLQQINTPISAVAIPALSRLQDKPERYRSYYLKAISLIALVTMPSVMFMIIMSENIIGVVLGEQWIGASRIFSILGISALIQPILNTTGWLYVSTGRTDRMFKWGIFASSLITVAFLIGLPYGSVGVASSYTTCFLLITFPCLWYAFKYTPVDISSTAKALWPTVTGTLVVGVALGLFKTLIPVVSAGVSGLVVGFGVTVVIFPSVLCVLARSLDPVLNIVGLFKKLKR